MNTSGRRSAIDWRTTRHPSYTASQRVRKHIEEAFGWIKEVGGWYISGIFRLWAGQPDLAIEHLEASRRLSPRARVGVSLAVIGYAHFLSRRFDEAVPKPRLAIQEDPGSVHPYRVLAACSAHMGRLDDAREIVARLRAITSFVIPDASFLQNPEHRDFFCRACVHGGLRQ